MLLPKGGSLNVQTDALVLSVTTKIPTSWKNVEMPRSKKVNEENASPTKQIKQMRQPRAVILKSAWLGESI